MRGRMLTYIHPGKVKLCQRVRSLNGKVNAGGDVCKPIAKLVQEIGTKGIDEETNKLRL